MKSAALMAVALLTLAGCATVGEFSYIDGRRYFQSEMNTYSVVVLDIDGKSYTTNPVLIEPGMRAIRVQGPPTAGFRQGETRTLNLDVKPCTRYYLKAVKENPLQQDFTPAVDYQEPISNCLGR